LIDGSHFVYLPVKRNKLMTVTIRHNTYMPLHLTVQVIDITKPSDPPVRHRAYEDEVMIMIQQFLQPRPSYRVTTKTYLSASTVAIVLALSHYAGYLLGGD
jgi:hypothetical protein